jgi:thiamine-phosphate pyrophosphorylase
MFPENRRLLTDIDSDTLRLIDACLNRAAEGLRTIEETARFILNDVESCESIKQIRHDLAKIDGHLSRTARLAARNTAGDVGTTIKTDSESVRVGQADIVAAACSRTQQSLRVIEEQLKQFDRDLAAFTERLRYRTYDAGAALELKLHVHLRIRRLQQSSLYVLVTAGASEKVFAENVRTLFECGVDIIQLRDRSITDRQLLGRCRVAQAVAHDCEKLFIVNDRVDMAAASDADGVHVGQDEMPAQEARKILGSQKIIGLSTHDIAQAIDATKQSVDYIGCGPVFPSKTKSFLSYTGTDWLARVAQQVAIPAFAIGGVQEANADQVAQMGMHRIAVSAALDPQTMNATQIRSTAQNLRSLIQAR